MISSGVDSSQGTDSGSAKPGLFGLFSSMFASRANQEFSQVQNNEPTQNYDYPAPNQGGFQPQQSQDYQYGLNQSAPGEEQEIPILEELDIDIEMIKANLKSVIMFKPFDHKFTEDPDMAGPLIVGLGLAFGLVLVSSNSSLGLISQSGKFTFGYIYGLIICGGLLIYSIVNLLIKQGYFMLYATISVLGYSLFPMVPLSLIGALIKIK